jgi:hypothetical protein
MDAHKEVPDQEVSQNLPTVRALDPGARCVASRCPSGFRTSRSLFSPQLTFRLLGSVKTEPVRGTQQGAQSPAQKKTSGTIVCDIELITYFHDFPTSPSVQETSRRNLDDRISLLFSEVTSAIWVDVPGFDRRG